MDISVDWHKCKSTLAFSLHRNDLVVQQQQQQHYLFQFSNRIAITVAISCHVDDATCSEQIFKCTAGLAQALLGGAQYSFDFLRVLK